MPKQDFLKSCTIMQRGKPLYCQFVFITRLQYNAFMRYFSSVHLDVILGTLFCAKCAASTFRRILNRPFLHFLIFIFSALFMTCP